MAAEDIRRQLLIRLIQPQHVEMPLTRMRRTMYGGKVTQRPKRRVMGIAHVQYNGYAMISGLDHTVPGFSDFYELLQ